MSVILTHGYFLEEDEKEQQIMKPYPPLGLLYVSAYLKQQGVHNEVIDSTFLSRDDWKGQVSSSSPHILAFYCNMMSKPVVLELIQFMKSQEALQNTIVIGGGPDLRYNVEDYLDAGFDYLVIGEGEESMYELVAAIEQDKPLQDIHGLAFKKSDGQVLKTPERVKIKAVDDLPIPNREGIDLSKYLDAWKHYHGKSTLSISTQRGCPYTCKWCSTAVYGQSYRRRSPKKVVEEMIVIRNLYKPDALWFVDDVFTVSHNWLRDFVKELQEAKISIPFECITRADRMNEEVIQLLKEAGCFRVWIGAESGSQKIIDAMDRRVDVQQVRKMLRDSKKAGIETGTFIMLGYPGETEEDINETITHLVESDPDHYTITVAYPIKGTSLYNEVELTNTPEWSTSTDRELEFKRYHSRTYYDLAVRKVYNEVGYHKSLKQGKVIRAMKQKAKSSLISLAMKTKR